MPIARDVNVTDNIIVNFSKRRENVQFTVNIANKGKRSVVVKKICCSLDFVTVLKFNASNSVISAGKQVDYLFEAEYRTPQTIDQIGGKIRFTFKNHTHITRSIKFVSDKDEKKIVKTNKENGRNNPSNQIAHTPALRNLRELIQKLYDDSLENSDGIALSPIDISDDLHIEFDRNHASKLCEIQIRNNTWSLFSLTLIEFDNTKISLCEDSNSVPILIAPRDDLRLHFQAHFIPEKYAGKTQICFWFGKICVRRTIAIQYQKRIEMSKSDYDIPIALNDLIESRHRMSSSEYMDALDDWVPSLQIDYGKHFHNLYYLDELLLHKEIKKTYKKDKAFFGEHESLKENGKTIRRKYEAGIYDLEVQDLYETRPSLQPGDKIFARECSAMDVVYEGEVIGLKEDDLVLIQFKDDFVKDFNNMAYAVEFDFPRVQYKRMHLAIDAAINAFGMEILDPTEIIGRVEPILDVRLNKNGKLQFENSKTELEWFNQSLDDDQKEAVKNILRGDMLNPYIIYGPPGTGKTTTLTELILQTVKNVDGSKIIVATQSNSASDLIVQRLIASEELDASSMIRLISRRYATRTDKIPEDVKEYVKTIDDLTGDTERRHYYKRLEKLANYRIVIGTLSTIAHLLESHKLRNTFTHALIDEAGQCTEPSALVPMVLVGKTGQTVLAGDPKQMPPLCFSPDTKRRGFDISMIERLFDKYENIKPNINSKGEAFRPISKLLHNYRSLPSILDYYNRQFYDFKLVPMIDSKTSSEAKLLAHLSGFISRRSEDGSSDYGIHFIDVNGKNVDKKHSWANILEAKMIETVVGWIKRLGLNSNDIGVIAPYVLQVRAIEHHLKAYSDIKVGTVEEFQGLERKVILISTTRTCPGGMKIDVSRHLGFVKCTKRINVAISRARAMVIVVGKGDLLCWDENWKALIDGCKSNNTYISTK